MLQCRDVEDCMLAYADKESSSESFMGSTLGNVYVADFNTTAAGQELEIDAGFSVGTAFCKSKVNSMSLADFDGDGSKEYIFTFMEIGTAPADIWVYYVDSTSSGSPLFEQSIQIDASGLSVSGTNCEVDDFGKYFSQPLVFDFDESPGTGLETAIAYQIEDDNFKINTYKRNGDFIDDHPEFINAESTMVGNVFLSNAFSDTGRVDFCATGFNGLADTIDVVCGTESNNHGLTSVDNFIFRYSTDGLTDTEETYSYPNVLAHSVDADGNQNFAEILNNYGIFKGSNTGYNGSIPLLGSFVVRQLNILYSNQHENSVIIPVNAERIGVDLGAVGSEDLIIRDQSNIYYLDDGLSNGGGNITSITFNPCPIGQIIKTNTSMEITVVITDTNNDLIGDDLVNSVLTTYKGNTNELIQTTNNVTSGASQPYTALLNATILGGTIEVQGFDNGRPSSVAIETFTLNVQDTGIEKGDVVCTETFIDEETGAALDTGLPPGIDANNGFVTGLRQLSEPAGISESAAFMFIWLIFVSAVFILTVSSGGGIMLGFGASMFLGLGGIIFGTVLGILSAGLIISIFVISLAILVIVGITFGLGTSRGM